MRFRVALAASIFISVQALAGPISRFDSKEASVSADSQKVAGEVERCLLDIDGAAPPHVYKQDDRPGRTTLIWTTPYNAPNARVDLEAAGTTTKVKAWGLEKQVRACL